MKHKWSEDESVGQTQSEYITLMQSLTDMLNRLELCVKSAQQEFNLTLGSIRYIRAMLENAQHQMDQAGFSATPPTPK